jgi:hypothetical protein
MESTWASGALELIKHADLHIDKNTAFDKRMAFICVDNCVEISIKTFLSLPKVKSGISVGRKEIDEAGDSFPRIVELLQKCVASKLVGIDSTDIEFYHRIRNKLYHEGTGLSVDEKHLEAYRGIAGVLLKNLFNIILPAKTDDMNMEKLISNWNAIENWGKKQMEEKGITFTYKWEKLYYEPIRTEIDHLRDARNRLVHSEKISSEDVKFWAKKSEVLLKELKKPIDYGVGIDEIFIERTCGTCGGKLIKKDDKTFKCPKCNPESE